MLQLQTTIVPKKLPNVVDSKPLFHMLFGTDTICNQRKSALPVDECAVIACYADKTGKIKRLIACDVAFANSAGAALSAMSPADAKDATKAGQLAENVLENLSEVMNVAVNLFIESFGARLELVSVKRLSELKPEMKDALSSPQRVKMEVTIPKYDQGKVDLIAV